VPDLCAGNAEFSEILRERRDASPAPTMPRSVSSTRAPGFDVHASTSTARGRVTARRRLAPAFDLMVSLAAIEHVFDSDNLLRFATSS
jgi:hypothetical protein